MASNDDGAEGAGPGPISLGPLDDHIAFHLRMAQGASFRASSSTPGSPGCARAGSRC